MSDFVASLAFEIKKDNIESKEGLFSVFLLRSGKIGTISHLFHYFLFIVFIIWATMKALLRVIYIFSAQSIIFIVQFKVPV